MLQLSMKRWNSALIAQGSRVTIVVVQVGAQKIHVTAVEAFKKKERQDETQFSIKIDGFLSFIPSLNANVFFCWFVLRLTLCMTKQEFWWCVCLTLLITLLVHRKSLRITQNHPKPNFKRFFQNLFLEIVVIVRMVWHKQLQEIIRFSNVWDMTWGSPKAFTENFGWSTSFKECSIQFGLGTSTYRTYT
jgi:hypothetical protein